MSHVMFGSRMLAFLFAGMLAGASTVTGAAQSEPTGVYLTPEELQEITAQFDDDVLTGGQVAPRISRWVNDSVFIFLQLDNPDVAQAT